jgi:hypothetical protein
MPIPSGGAAGPRDLSTGCWTLLVLPLFCLFLVDKASKLALSALSFCNLRMGLLVGLGNHILGLHLVVGHNSSPLVSGVNVAIAGRFLLAALPRLDADCPSRTNGRGE